MRPVKKTIIIILLTALLTTELSGIAANAKNSDSSRCTPYVFLAMRGSGQNDIDPKRPILNAFGPELASLYEELSQRPKFKGNISWANFPPKENRRVIYYKADGVSLSVDYVDSVVNNSTLSVATQIADYSKDCGASTKFILAGYSQGAYAVHWIVNFLEDNRPEIAKRIVAAVFLADPAKTDSGLLPLAWSLKHVDKKSIINTSLQGCVAAHAALIQSVYWIKDKLQFLNLNSKSKNENLQVTQNEAVDYAYGKFCGNLDQTLNYAATKDFKLRDPRTVPFIYINERLDVVADTATLIKLMVPMLPASVLSATATIGALFKYGANIHSSYCPTEGQYAPKNSGSKCDYAHHKKFIDQSIALIEKYTPDKPLVLKVDSDAIRSNQIMEEWFGDGWQGSTTTCEIILQVFSRPTPEFLNAVKIHKYRVIAINQTTKASLLLFVSENSGDPIGDYFVGTQLFDYYKKNLETISKGKFIENGGTPSGFYKMLDDDIDKYWAPYYLDVSNSNLLCKKSTN